MLGEILVVAVLVFLAALAVRSIWKDRKKGGCCGDCSRCRGCKRGERDPAAVSPSGEERAQRLV